MLQFNIGEGCITHSAYLVFFGVTFTRPDIGFDGIEPFHTNVLDKGNMPYSLGWVFPKLLGFMALTAFQSHRRLHRRPYARDARTRRTSETHKRNARAQTARACAATSTRGSACVFCIFIIIKIPCCSGRMRFMIPNNSRFYFPLLVIQSCRWPKIWKGLIASVTPRVRLNRAAHVLIGSRVIKHKKSVVGH